jgi:hypothetical protein
MIDYHNEDTSSHLFKKSKSLNNCHNHRASLVAIMASMYLDLIEEKTTLGSLRLCHEMALILQ